MKEYQLQIAIRKLIIAARKDTFPMNMGAETAYMTGLEDALKLMDQIYAGIEPDYPTTYKIDLIHQP